MSSSDTVQLTDGQLKAVEAAFRQYAHGGVIPTSALGLVMRDLGHNLRRQQLRELVAAVDTDDSGTVDFDEFLPLMAAQIKEREELSFYKNLFRMLDKKNKGFITCADLRYILQGLAKEVDLTAEDIDFMITEIDEDGNGEVSFDEFYKLMTTE